MNLFINYFHNSLHLLDNNEFLVAMGLGVTPVPIPNTMVKTWAAENTILVTVWKDRWLPNYGGIAQLGEHLPCKQGVTSSNLVISTGRKTKICSLKTAY